MLNKIANLFKRKQTEVEEIALPDKCGNCPYMLVGRLADAKVQHVWCGHLVENETDWKPSFVRALDAPPDWCLLRKKEEKEKEEG